MMHDNNYEINIQNYTTNPDITSINDGNDYWSSKRLLAASVYQYYVYQYARSIFYKEGLERVVDVGCGPAKKLLKFFGNNKINIIGIDQEKAISYCKRKYNIGNFVVEDFNNVCSEFKGSRTLFICCDVIEHVTKPDNLLNFLNQNMTNDSILIISTPERNCLRGVKNRRPSNLSHIREWSLDEFKRFLQKHGFRIKESKVLYPIKKTINIFNIIHIFKQLRKNLPLKTNQVHQVVLNK